MNVLFFYFRFLFYVWCMYYFWESYQSVIRLNNHSYTTGISMHTKAKKIYSRSCLTYTKNNHLAIERPHIVRSLEATFQTIMTVNGARYLIRHFGIRTRTVIIKSLACKQHVNTRNTKGRSVSINLVPLSTMLHRNVVCVCVEV